MIRTVLTASALALAVAGPGAAQGSIPAEFPPESYSANQYVDSEGCAFIRAGIGGMTNWIPRMNRAREPLCGFQPSRTAAAPALPVVADPAPERSAPAPARRSAAAAAPASPQVRAPEPARAAAPAKLTRAAFCANRSGPQPGYVSSATGKTIICGEAGPNVTTAAATATPGAPLRGAYSLAAVCADMAATGRRYVLQESGAPVTCGPQRATAPRPGTQLAAMRLPAAPARPGAAAIPGAPVAAGRGPVAAVSARCELGSGSGHALIGPGRHARRCGPQAQSPSGLANAARLAPQAPAGVMAFLDPRAEALDVAASAVALPDPAAPPRGYRRAWEDGRLNPNRGVRIVERAGAGQVRAPVTAAPVTVPTALLGRVSTRSAPAAMPQAASAGRFVQVGSYGVAANAERAAARLRAMGLQVARGRSGGLQIVATGPYAAGAPLAQALARVRAAGYTDAFARK
ncbi:SPOR domain-containing protein [Limimaricola cinnabarinus]|uniref:SPOR domain-containing protein n=1 Tax=Limimaricola cinnabarinus TaxID=1125964 RepID=UPI0024915D68|nr:SPOR domain-containing protein [Limimaricola cinnabarinus]